MVSGPGGLQLHPCGRIAALGCRLRIEVGPGKWASSTLVGGFYTIMWVQMHSENSENSPKTTGFDLIKLSDCVGKFYGSAKWGVGGDQQGSLFILCNIRWFDQRLLGAHH
ncbi:hypothetical protein M758_8G015700 [Ceratodon purpureus]|uniref:Uncharacterized protein n=1 Tax=Ceratodon purpureus TaxID=3225 RepID=A0A8T0H2B5_CERPU|nr:hypothetical protein KC19_8G016000 [Ceratodon purpureus]KAG0607279.1 hypothetical protein M758_8G015700 [Ceratodon purpureus]